MSNLDVVFEYFAAKPFVTAGYAVAMTSVPLAAVLVPAVGGAMVDNIKSDVPFAVWRWKLIAIIGMFAVIVATYMLGTYLDSFAKTDFMGHIRKRMLDKVIESRSYSYSPVQVTSTMTKMVMIPYGCFDIVRIFRANFIPGLLTMLSIIIYCFWVDPKIGALMAALLTTMIGVMVGGSFTCQDGLIAAEYGSERLLERTGDMLETLRKTLMVDARAEEAARRDRDFREQRELTRGAFDCANHFTALVKVIVGLTLIGIIIYAYTRYRDGSLPSSKMMSLLFVLMCSRHLLFNAMGAFPALLQDNAEVVKLQTFLEQLDNQRGGGSTTTATAARDKLRNADAAASKTASLQFSDVTYAYPQQRAKSRANAVDGVSFELAADDVMLVQGTIGCGKSTLALLALGLDSPKSGRIRINGVDVTRLSRTDLARLVTYVPQTIEMLNRTVLENIVHGRPEITREMVQAKFDEFGVDFIGVDDRVAKQGARLSGGQKLVLTLIGAILHKETAVLVLDEVTANLDKQTRAAVIELINEAAKGQVVLFISHDPPPGIRFTKTLRMENGKGEVEYR